MKGYSNRQYVDFVCASLNGKYIVSLHSITTVHRWNIHTGENDKYYGLKNPQYTGVRMSYYGGCLILIVGNEIIIFDDNLNSCAILLGIQDMLLMSVGL